MTAYYAALDVHTEAHRLWTVAAFGEKFVSEREIDRLWAIVVSTGAAARAAAQ